MFLLFKIKSRILSVMNKILSHRIFQPVNLRAMPVFFIRNSQSRKVFFRQTISCSEELFLHGYASQRKSPLSFVDCFASCSQRRTQTKWRYKILHALLFLCDLLLSKLVPDIQPNSFLITWLPLTMPLRLSGGNLSKSCCVGVILCPILPFPDGALVSRMCPPSLLLGAEKGKFCLVTLVSDSVRLKQGMTEALSMARSRKGETDFEGEVLHEQLSLFRGWTPDGEESVGFVWESDASVSLVVPLDDAEGGAIMLSRELWVWDEGKVLAVSGTDNLREENGWEAVPNEDAMLRFL